MTVRQENATASTLVNSRLYHFSLSRVSLACVPRSLFWQSYPFPCVDKKITNVLLSINQVVKPASILQSFLKDVYGGRVTNFWISLLGRSGKIRGPLRENFVKKIISFLVIQTCLFLVWENYFQTAGLWRCPRKRYIYIGVPDNPAHLQITEGRRKTYSNKVSSIEKDISGKPASFKMAFQSCLNCPKF